MYKNGLGEIRKVDVLRKAIAMVLTKNRAIL